MRRSLKNNSNAFCWFEWGGKWRNPYSNPSAYALASLIEKKTWKFKLEWLDLKTMREATKKKILSSFLNKKLSSLWNIWFPNEVASINTYDTYKGNEKRKHNKCSELIFFNVIFHLFFSIFDFIVLEYVCACHQSRLFLFFVSVSCTLTFIHSIFFSPLKIKSRKNTDIFFSGNQKKNDHARALNDSYSIYGFKLFLLLFLLLYRFGSALISKHSKKILSFCLFTVFIVAINQT